MSTQSLTPIQKLRLAVFDEDTLNARMAKLSPKERDIIKMRFGIDNGHQYTLDEVARTFNVTKGRVRQLESRTLKKLLIDDDE